MKSTVFVVIFAIIGCAVNDLNSSAPEALSIAEAVSVASERALKPAELGGEKDERILKALGDALADKEDKEIVESFRRMDPQSVASLRLFFKPADFEGRDDLIGKPKPESLIYLNALPIPRPWPIEVATASAWGEDGLRLDWKAKN